ncbi:unnamed protein product [Pelagomonas calceolata]|uniref:Histone-lysine N-methyltransferase, H3 lysine-79 specific n=1 Tax=Pelagomonas calceolata TaxID=35677 RepID=A0A7S4E8K0_9STRA|nr:unnamed protein product [Pelagomonas calceolata]|mmetsp:Transcript_17105/g.48787  ORF Transcript_17105/g.48787 Transcript_17105/m.48787 type:complete len:339 (-) Transcript_17105:103-1119(-)
MTEIVELTPGQSVKVATKELVVRVKVRGYGRGRLTVEAVATGGLFASASKSGPDACDWTASQRAVGWRVVIEPQWWVHASDFCFVRFGFAAHARDPAAPDYLGVEFEPLTLEATQFSVAVAYESEESQMPADLREAYRAWHQAVTETEIVSSTLVLAGRRALGREKDQELTYGEVLFRPFHRLLDEVVKPRPGEVFVDLGSGTGRAVFVAALCWPALAACKGYEVSPPLHSDAARCHGELSGSVMAPVELHCADVLRRDDWAAADIVWIASVCLSDGTLRAIAARLVSLKPGARVVHMTEHFLRDDDAFERVAEDPILVEMSFGVTGVFVARRRGPSE